MEQTGQPASRWAEPQRRSALCANGARLEAVIRAGRSAEFLPAGGRSLWSSAHLSEASHTCQPIAAGCVRRCLSRSYVAHREMLGTDECTWTLEVWRDPHIYHIYVRVSDKVEMRRECTRVCASRSLNRTNRNRDDEVPPAASSRSLAWEPVNWPPGRVPNFILRLKTLQSKPAFSALSTELSNTTEDVASSESNMATPAHAAAAAHSH